MGELMHRLVLMVLLDRSDEYVSGPPNNSLPRRDPFGRADRGCRGVCKSYRGFRVLWPSPIKRPLAAHLPALAVHLCLDHKYKQGACGPLV